MRVNCGNCGNELDDDDCVIVHNVTERHEVGDLYSNLECPECGSLCYPNDPNEHFPYYDVNGQMDVLRRLGLEAALWGQFGPPVPQVPYPKGMF